MEKRKKERESKSFTSTILKITTLDCNSTVFLGLGDFVLAIEKWLMLTPPRVNPGLIEIISVLHKAHGTVPLLRLNIYLSRHMK